MKNQDSPIVVKMSPKKHIERTMKLWDLGQLGYPHPFVDYKIIGNGKHATVIISRPSRIEPEGCVSIHLSDSPIDTHCIIENENATWGKSIDSIQIKSRILWLAAQIALRWELHRMGLSMDGESV